ncbi:MAG: aldose 1-epimerase [Ferruginibacter sp.]|nr:aldose 1-epimerase [Ferruginibacter sp.]
MFAIEVSNTNSFDKIVLKDTLAKTFVDIIPSCGATLHSFTVLHNEYLLNVIDHYDSAEDFTLNVSSKGFKSCKLSPFACRLNNAAYHFGEKEYSIQKFLLNANALHGLLYDAQFAIMDHYADEASAGVALKYAYTGNDKGYPFHYDCVVAYHLKKENELSIVTEIINKDKGLIPIQDGWHPYFTFGGKIDEVQLEFQSKEKLVYNEALIPTGELVPYEEFTSLKKIGDTLFDNCFTLNFAECQPLCVLRDTKQKLQIEIRPDKHYPYLQIYTPPHRNSIAIENLSAAPDAFNNKMGLIILQPGENIIFSTTYKITSLI